MTDEKIIDQIRKIKRLADAAGTEGEAAAAAAAMARLLSKHNLDISQIDLNAEATEAVGEHMVKQKNTSQWRTLLLHYVAKYNFCYTLTTTRWEGRGKVPYTILIGQPHNREVAEFLFRTLESTATRLANKHGYKYTGPDAHGSEGYSALETRKSFITGMVMTIGNRLATEWQQFQAPAGVVNDRALVLVNQTAQQIQSYLAVAHPYTRPGKGMRDVNASAFAHGQQVGKTVGLHRGMTAGQGASNSLGSGRK